MKLSKTLSALYAPDPVKRTRYGWIVRIIGTGRDKSDYQITRVQEPPGFQGTHLTLLNGIKIPRNGQSVHPYRADARKEKAKGGWKTNRNSWGNQSNDDEIYYHW